MILRNKRTGQVVMLTHHNFDNFHSLAEINEEWEDYEETETYYYISDFGAIREGDIGKYPEDEEDRKRIGNYFLSQEDAEKAVKKLEAWERLEDKGFEFEDWHESIEALVKINGGFDIGYELSNQDEKDLDLLFGDEDE